MSYISLLIYTTTNLTTYVKIFVSNNGTKECEPIKKLRLSDAFIQEDSNQEFEWTATMIRKPFR